MEIKKSSLLFIFVLLYGICFGQSIETGYTLKQMKSVFEQGKDKINWDFPTGENTTQSITWHKRQGTNKNSVQYAGYQDDRFVATLVFNGDKVLGSLNLKDQKITLINNKKNKIVVWVERISKDIHCGNETNKDFRVEIEHDHSHKQLAGEMVATGKDKEQSKAVPGEVLNRVSGANGYRDQVLRVFRIVLPIAYFYTEEGKGEMYKKAKEQGVSLKDYIYNWWDEAEMGLNEIYLRDIGVKMEVVKDERLILKKDVSESFRYTAQDDLLIKCTDVIENALKEDKEKNLPKVEFDLGLIIGVSKNANISEKGELSGLLGYAEFAGAAVYTDRANGFSIADVKAMSHEIGHLFGADHTYSTELDGSPTQNGLHIKTEVLTGQSTMSYGTPMDFFSLPSIMNQIRPTISTIKYYTDKADKKNVKYNKSFSFKANRIDIQYYKRTGKIVYNPVEDEEKNTVFAIETNKHSPVLDRSKIKDQYKIPVNTFFEFRLQATDKDNDKLTYMAHPADLRPVFSWDMKEETIITENQDNSKAQFITQRPTTTGIISFQTQYEEPQFKSVIENKNGVFSVRYPIDLRVKPYPKYEYEINKNLQMEKEFTSMTEVYKYVGDATYVDRVDGKKPKQGKFKFWLAVRDSENTMDFSLDRVVTYDLEEVEVEIVPNTKPFVITNKQDFTSKEFKQGQEVVVKWDVDEMFSGTNVKISVSDDLGQTFKYVVAESVPNNGQATIKMPMANIGTKNLKLKYDIDSEIDTQINLGVIKVEVIDQIAYALSEYRQIDAPIFKGTVNTFDQGGNMTVENKPKILGGFRVVAPQTNEDDKNKENGGETPTPTNPNPTPDPTPTPGDNNTTKIIDDKEKEKDDSKFIHNPVEKQIKIYNYVGEESSQNYFRVARGIQEEKKIEKLEIFNKLGQKVFETKGTTEKENKFKGYANLNVIGDKKLPSGTYFYICTYTDAGEQKQKTGFLYVK